MRLSNEQERYVKELAIAAGGEITPDILIKDAKKKSSPLHNLFEWDQAKAAMVTWRNIARNIISSVRIIETERTMCVPTPAFVENPDKARGKQGYVSTISLRSNKEKSRMALHSYLLRAEGHMQRAREVAISLNLDHEVESLLAHIRDVRNSA